MDAVIHENTYKREEDDFYFVSDMLFLQNCTYQMVMF